MTTVAQIRAAIVAAHAAIADVGKVHDRERYSRSDDKMRALYTYERAPNIPKQIRGWWWRRIGTESREIDIATVGEIHTWECRGYMALNDDEASETEFDALIEAFRDSVRADPTFGGVCVGNPMGEPEGVQLLAAGPVMFCSVLCHSAVLQLKTWSYL